MFAQKLDKLRLRAEPELSAGIYFLHKAFHLTCHAPADVPKLNHECSLHDEYRILQEAVPPRGYFVGFA